MFRNLFKNRKGQNTAEYALLIALVVAGIVAMQQYAQRALQARVRDASTYLATSTGTIGNSKQYEPYYTQSKYTSNKDVTENKRLAAGTVAMDAVSNRSRMGNETTTYDTTLTADETNAAMPSGI